MICNTSLYPELKTLKTVSRGQYNRWIIKIIAVRFYDTFIIKFCEQVFHGPTASFKDFQDFYHLLSGFAHCYTTMTLKMLTSISTFNNSTFILLVEFLKRPLYEAFHMWSWVYPDFRPFICFVHLYRIFNNLHYKYFHFHWSYDV